MKTNYTKEEFVKGFLQWANELPVHADANLLTIASNAWEKFDQVNGVQFNMLMVKPFLEKIRREEK